MLRKLPADLLTAARAKAQAAGLSVPAVLVALLRAWVAGRVEL